MRLGFITQLLWPRYGDFWTGMVRETGVDVQLPEPDTTLQWLQDERLAKVAGPSFRLAAAQALALQDSDLLIAPDMNRGVDSSRGSGQNPWISSFPETLATTVGGLPPVVGVPTDLDAPLETAAVKLLHTLSRDPAVVRRVWGRYRGRAKAPRHPSVRWSLQPSEKEAVGLLAQPWHVSEALVETFQTEHVHVISQHHFDPQTLREDAWRSDPKLVPTDAEVLGAARLLSRRGSIARLQFIADKTSGADIWLVKQVSQLTRKPVSVSYLQDLDALEILLRGD